VTGTEVLFTYGRPLVLLSVEPGGRVTAETLCPWWTWLSDVHRALVVVTGHTVALHGHLSENTTQPHSLPDPQIVGPSHGVTGQPDPALLAAVRPRADERRTEGSGGSEWI